MSTPTRKPYWRGQRNTCGCHQCAFCQNYEARYQKFITRREEWESRKAAPAQKPSATQGEEKP